MKKNAKNPAQAGDAVLAFHYAEYHEKFGEVTYKRETRVHVSEKPDFHSSDHHGTGFILEFWSVLIGIVNIPLLPKGNLYDSIFAMDFTKYDLENFSHVIMKSQWTNLGGTGESKTSIFGIEISHSSWVTKGGTEKTEHVDIYRLDNLNKSLILAKTEY